MVTVSALVLDSQVHFVDVSLESRFVFSSEITLITNKFGVIVAVPEMSIEMSLKAELTAALLTDKSFLFMHCLYVSLEELLMLANEIT